MRRPHRLGPIDSAAACFREVANSGLPVTRNRTLKAGSSAPAGCSVRSTQAGYEATFNTNSKSTKQCGPANATAPVRATGSVSVGPAAAATKKAVAAAAAAARQR